jgi:hypothetical protein
VRHRDKRWLHASMVARHGAQREGVRGWVIQDGLKGVWSHTHDTLVVARVMQQLPHAPCQISTARHSTPHVSPPDHTTPQPGAFASPPSHDTDSMDNVKGDAATRWCMSTLGEYQYVVVLVPGSLTVGWHVVPQAPATRSKLQPIQRP